jgi:tripartite ATP-independent transporter DctM subunit
LFALKGDFSAFTLIGQTAFTSSSGFIFLTIPMFILMGEMMVESRVSSGAFEALDKWLGRVPGGFAVTSIAVCAVFGAASGASIACTAAVGSVAVPEMLRRRYDVGLATGSVASAAGLDIVIPPSIMMVIYAFIAGVPLGRLMIGGFIPGFMVAGMFGLYVMIRAHLQPYLAPPSEEPASWRERLSALRFLLPIGFLIFLVLGLIWLGVATPTEAAALGAMGSSVLASLNRQLKWTNIRQALLATAELTSSILFILIGASAFSRVLAYLGVGRMLTEFVVSLGISPWYFLIATQVVVAILGCLMDTGSILFITMPLFVPVVQSLGFDPLWYGIVIMMNLGMAAITPPVGLNLFVMKSITPPDVTMADIIRGVTPFIIIDAVAIALLMAVPQLSLWLPGLMGG